MAVKTVDFGPLEDHKVFHCTNLAKYSSIVTILTENVDYKYINPYTYLSASHEVFGLTLVLTWAITLIGYSDEITQHPGLKIIGTWNPCFGWDYAPASYFGLGICSSNVFFTWRYCWLIHVRALLLEEDKGWRNWMYRKASIYFALSTNIWCVLWIIGPTTDAPGTEHPHVEAWLGHTCIFMNYVITAYATTLLHYLEVKWSNSKYSQIDKKNTIFLIVYGIFSAYIVLIYLYDLLCYGATGEVCASPTLVSIANVGWMGCVMIHSNYAATFYDLRFEISVIECYEDEDDKEICEAKASTAPKGSGYPLPPLALKDTE